MLVLGCSAECGGEAIPQQLCHVLENRTNRMNIASVANTADASRAAILIAAEPSVKHPPADPAARRGAHRGA